MLSGVAFRDAYKQVGLKIQEGNYKPDYHIDHTHEGSIGHLCHAEINAKMESVLYTFDFDGILEKEQALLAEK